MKRVLLVALMLLFTTPAWPQGVEIKKPAPTPTAPGKEPDVIPPGLQQETRPGDADKYPRGGQVQYDPAFIGPMSKPYEAPGSTGRYGVAGWVSPHTPVGSPHSGWAESYGVFAFGFAFTWDGPPPARRPAVNPKP
jgi:hypothetical protein